MVPNEVSLYCPHCGRFTAVTPAPMSLVNPRVASRYDDPYVNLSSQVGVPFYAYAGGGWWLGKCNACEKPVLVLNGGEIVLPPPQAGPVSQDIPEPMRSDLHEAKKCMTVAAWNAAAVMARRALQCSAVEQGAPKGKRLGDQIKWLGDNHKITAQQREWADAARWVGNHGAHDTEPDVGSGNPVITDVSQEDAEATIDLVEHLFETLYVATRSAREQLAKRGKPTGGKT